MIVNNNLSALSTNPSSSQVLIRNQGKAISDSNAIKPNNNKQFQNNRDQQKQLLVLNQRYIKDRQLNTKKLAQVVSSRNHAGTVTAPSEEITLGIQRIPTYEVSKTQIANTVKQTKVEQIKNIYNKANCNDNYQIMQGKMKMPSHYSNKQGKFDNTRNSEISGLSVGVVSQYSVHKSSKNQTHMHGGFIENQKSMNNSQYSKKSGSFQQKSIGQSKGSLHTSLYDRFIQNQSGNQQSKNMQSIEVIGYGSQNGKFIQNTKATQSAQNLNKGKKKENIEVTKFINTKKINIIKGSKSQKQYQYHPNLGGLEQNELQESLKLKAYTQANQSLNETQIAEKPQLQKTQNVQHKIATISKKYQETALNKLRSEEFLQDNIRNYNQSDRIAIKKTPNYNIPEQLPMTLTADTHADNTLENSFADNILIKNINSQNTTQDQAGLQYFQQQGKKLKIQMKSESKSNNSHYQSFVGNKQPPNQMSLSRMVRGPKPETLSSNGEQLPQISYQCKSESKLQQKKGKDIQQKINAKLDYQQKKDYQNGFSQQNMNMIKGKMNVFESIEAMNNIQNFDLVHNHNNKSFDNIRDHDSQSVVNKNSTAVGDSATKAQRSGTHSYTSLEKIQRPDTQSKSVINIKSRVRDISNNSLSKMKERTEDSFERRINQVQLAPLYQGGRQTFGPTPGTANTHGGATRHINQKHSQLIQHHMPSQKCQSELYHDKQIVQNETNLNVYENNQQVNIKQSNFDESFENLFANHNFENLGVLDPREEMEDLQSLSNIPISRPQKSQGTYRIDHDQINQQIHSHYSNNLLNIENSQSELYDNNSQSNIYEINSAINDMQIQMKSQLSLGSNNSGNRGEVITAVRNDSHLSKRESKEDEMHPFNGPKLHLFRKGQSKSSQMKSRKIKTSDQNRRFVEMNSQANSQQNNVNRGIHSYYNFNKNQQMSEGGNPNFQNMKNTSFKENGGGHINVSDILNGKIQPGLINGNNQASFEQIYTDNHSFDSQGLMSANSNEFQLKNRLVEHHNLLDKVENNSIQVTPVQHPKLQNIRDQIMVSTEANGVEARSLQCPSQFSTLQQKEEISPESRVDIEGYNNCQHQEKSSSPYISSYNQSKREGQMSIKSLMKIQDLQNPQLRPNTTNHIFLDKNIENANQSPGIQQPLYNGGENFLPPLVTKNQVVGSGSSHHGHQSFQHPKVGKNSKHPFVFKQHSNSQKSFKSQQQKNFSKQVTNQILLSENNQIFGGGQMLQSPENTEKNLQPNQTGDFPSPREIRTYAGDSDEEYEVKEEHYALQKGTISSELEQEKFVSLLTLQKEEQSGLAPGSQPAAEYANRDMARNYKSRQGGARSVAQPLNLVNADGAEEAKHAGGTNNDQSPYQEYIDGKEEMQSNKKSPTKQESKILANQQSSLNSKTITATKAAKTQPSKSEAKASASKSKKQQPEEHHVAAEAPTSKAVENSAPQHSRQESFNQTHHIMKTSSVAQTPCFAETPNTTDQFKNYKIHDKGEVSSSLQQTEVQIILINNLQMQNKNKQQNVEVTSN